MFSKGHYFKGFVKNLFNPRISKLAFVSSNVTVDKTACIYRGVKAKHASIGAHTYISANTDIEGAEIGRFCSIADNCRIGMAGHTLSCLSTSPIFTAAINCCQEQWVEQNVFTAEQKDVMTYVGNDVWIGSHALVRGGITVGDGACIAAGAVVVKDVPPYAVVGGVPAKVIRYRFPQETIDKLEDLKWWDMPDDVLKKNIRIFQSENIPFEDIKFDI